MNPTNFDRYLEHKLDDPAWAEAFKSTDTHFDALFAMAQQMDTATLDECKVLAAELSVTVPASTMLWHGPVAVRSALQSIKVIRSARTALINGATWTPLTREACAKLYSETHAFALDNLGDAAFFEILADIAKATEAARQEQQLEQLALLPA